MIGKTVSHYKILEKIGEGGMGVVYKAEDTKLKRTIALKFLPPEFTRNNESKERFNREAQAAAALSHPNIVTIYEINEFEGQTFIAMEYVEGQTLRELIVDGGAASLLEKKEIINIITQICEGLQKAHDAGIVHRDIKPENILIDKSGRIKILDFGLARIKGMDKLTKDDVASGTFAYMSPEQFKRVEVDHRTDIWSFGVVLFEILTGQLPFQGMYEAQIIYSVMNESPKAVINLRPDTPQNLEQIVKKTLEKDPADRYQSMEKIIRKLKEVPTINDKEPKQKESIIVLPFENMSSDSEQEYFSDGLTEEVITDLSLIHDLLVISRSSAMTFKGTKKTIPEIVKQVNVRYVLEGSVRKAGNNLRIIAQLIDATTDTHLWAEKYSGTLNDIFDIQEKVSRSIVDALKVRLTSNESFQLSERPKVNVQAYECYLRARREMLMFSKEAIERTVQYLNNGLALIGENPLLYAGLGYAYFQYVNIGVKHEESIHKAVEYAHKALALDKKSSEALTVLGIINMAFLGNQNKAFEFLKQAQTITPHDPHVLTWLIAGYSLIGKPEQARPLVLLLGKVDPLTPMSSYMTVFQDVMEGNFDLSVNDLTGWLKMEPQNPFALFFTTLFLTYCHHFDEVQFQVDKNAQESSDDVGTLGSYLVKYAIDGDRKGIELLLSDQFVKTMQRDSQFSYFVAAMLALANMEDEALHWLLNAVKRGFINYPFISEYDPFFKKMRGDEHFKKLMKRVKHEWENFEV